MKNKDIKFFFVVCVLGIGTALGMVHSCASKVVPPAKEICYVEDSSRIVELEKLNSELLLKSQSLSVVMAHSLQFLQV